MSAVLLVVIGLSVEAADLGVIEIVAPSSESTATPFEIGDTPEGEFTGFREVIEKEELQKAGGSLAEVVAAQSGVQYRQSGGLGTFSSISLRGSTAEQVNVYVDGVLLNEAAGGGVNLSHIELLQADRVEVYRGTVPVQLGNSAIGGAVNITSARATDRAATTLLAGFGSFGSRQFSSAFTGPVNWLNDQRVVASFSHRESENDFSFLNDNGTSFNQDDDEIQRRRNDQTSSTSGFFKSGHQLSSGGRVEHALQLNRHNQHISDWRNTSNNGAQIDTDFLQWRTTLTSVAEPGRWSSLWGAHVAGKNEFFSASELDNDGQGLHADTTVVGGRGYWEKLSGRNSYYINARLRSEKLESFSDSQTGNRTEAERLKSDVNLQWNRTFNDADSLFSASVFGFLLQDDYSIENNISARDDFTDGALTPQLGFQHSIATKSAGLWSLTANASRHKRAPSFFELFGSRGLFVGNSSLETETSNNVDIGLEWRSDVSRSVDAAVQVVLFYSKKENLISRVYNARGIGRSENIAQARSSGVEFVSRFAFNNGLSLDANFTIQDPENLSNISGFTGRQLPGESATDGTLALGWKNNRWEVGYEFKFSSTRFFDSPNLLPATDQRLHNIRLGRDWADWRLDLTLNNLTDKNYEDFNGYPRPGRAGFISFVYKPKAKE